MSYVATGDVSSVAAEDVSSIATKAPTAAAQPNTLMNRLFGTGGEEQPTDNTDTIAQPAENPIANEQQETAAEPLQAAPRPLQSACPRHLSQSVPLHRWVQSVER